MPNICKQYIYCEMNVNVVLFDGMFIQIFECIAYFVENR